MTKRRVSKGSWQIDRAHNLVYIEDGKRTTLKGDLIAAGDNSLAFEVNSRDEQGNDHLRVLKLSGGWQADERNRLVFTVNNNRDEGVLVFRNDWELDGNQNITYTYTRSRTGIRREFVLQGHWNLSALERIAYCFDSGKRLEFRCQLESLSLQPKRGAIKFRIGAGIGQTVTVFGSWRFSRNLAIDFEAGKNGSLTLETQVSLGKRNTLRLALKNTPRQGKSVKLELSRRFLKRLDAEAFARIKLGERNRGVEAGVKIPF